MSITTFFLALALAPSSHVQGTGTATPTNGRGVGQMTRITARATTVQTAHQTGWRKILAERLPLLGHRNWICVVDSAYPWQNSSGIELVDTHSDHITVLKAVLEALKKAPHVRPDVFIDKELEFVPEADAKGIGALHKSLMAVLPKNGVLKQLHGDTIAELDKAGGTFKVLMLKTNLTLPYTSVFLRLNCGYWSDGAEKRMRTKMGGE